MVEIQYKSTYNSKRRAQERNESEQKLQEEYAKAKYIDSLERDFLQRCSESFNFGPNFIRWLLSIKTEKATVLLMVSPLITSQLNEELGEEIHSLFLINSLQWPLKPWLLQLDKIQW